MKYLSKFFVLSIIGIFASCSDNSQLSEEGSEIRTPKRGKITAADLEIVGIEHNAGLDKLYQGFLRDNVSPSNTKSYTIDVLTSHIEEFHDTQHSIELGIDEMTDQLENYSDTDVSYYSNSTIASLLTSREKQYLDELHRIVNDTINTVPTIIAKISLLEDDIESETGFSDEQLVTLYSATNIAKYSLVYWETHLDDWDDLDGVDDIQPLAVSKKGRKNFQIVAGADIAGGVTAAVTTWVLNSVPGAGQVGYTGAIMAGAIGGSVGAAVGIALDLWGW